VQVKIIYLHEDFVGAGNDDISVLVLENKISFSNGLAAPVCIDWRSKYNLFNGDLGKVNLFNIYLVFSVIKYII